MIPYLMTWLRLKHTRVATLPPGEAGRRLKSDQLQFGFSPAVAGLAPSMVALVALRARPLAGLCNLFLGWDHNLQGI